MRYRRYCIYGGKLTVSYDLCQLHLFCDIIQLQYVGTTTYDTHRMLYDVFLVLSGLKLVSKVKVKIVSLIPDIIYHRFIEFLLLLAPPPPISHLDRLALSFFL